MDADYRGEVKVVNHGSSPKQFEGGDRIAQIIIEKIANVPAAVSSELSNMSRGGRGFGSSGIAARSLRSVSGALHGRGEPVPDRAQHGRGEAGQEETLPARGDPGHEGGLLMEVFTYTKGAPEVWRCPVNA